MAAGRCYGGGPVPRPDGFGMIALQQPGHIKAARVCKERGRCFCTGTKAGAAAGTGEEQTLSLVVTRLLCQSAPGRSQGWQQSPQCLLEVRAGREKWGMLLHRKELEEGVQLKKSWLI